MMMRQQQDPVDAVIAWLTTRVVGNAADGDDDAALRGRLVVAVDACGDDEQDLCALLQRLERVAGHSDRYKWNQLVEELQRTGSIMELESVSNQVAKLKLRFPHDRERDYSVLVVTPEKRLSAPLLRSANSLEISRISVVARSTRVLRRALTEDPDCRLPLLEPPYTSSMRGAIMGSSSSTTTRSFLHRMSAILQTTVEDTFFCFICFENVPETHAFTLLHCGHKYCHDCLTMYLEVKIRDGEVYPTCFHDMGDATGSRVACSAQLVPSDIQALVSPAVWEKYRRFKFNKEFEHARQCPYCSHSQNCLGPEHPECICENCKRSYCFLHSNAHEGDTCADFERQNMEAEKINRTAIASIAKPCPGCQSNVEKNGGCNHMTCIACQTSFCWICGHVVDNVAAPDHFAWWNLSGCAGQQLVDIDSQTRVERIGWCLFRVLFLVVCVPIATVITLALTILTGCCIPCIFWVQEDPIQTFVGTVNNIALFVQLLIAFVVVGPISLLAIMFRCLRSTMHHYQLWVSPPPQPSSPAVALDPQAIYALDTNEMRV